MKRVWIKAIPKLKELLNQIQYNYLILRIDFIDKNILRIIKLYQPILEYPTPPIETTLKNKPFYHKLAIKYNKEALEYSKFNLTTLDIGYPNAFIFPNSLNDQHTKKINYKINNEIKILLMSSKYGPFEYNGYDRFLKGLEKFILFNSKYKISLIVAGKDINGFKDMINDTLRDNISIEYLGFKNISHFKNIIDNIDLGINDLAAHRIGLNEANALKTIDFIGWNLPFILSHKDINLKKNQKFYMKVDQSDEPINIENIIKFLKKINHDIIDQMKYQQKEISLENRIKGFIMYLENNNV